MSFNLTKKKDIKILSNIRTWIFEHRYPLIVGLIVALLAHMYMFTNKLPNCDDVIAQFSKGAMFDSGRWGLFLLQFVIPNFSTPWIFGIISVLLVVLSGCIIADVFEIKNIVFQCFLTSIIVIIPAFTGVFLYMFTSSSYAVGIFLCIAAFKLFVEKNKVKNIIGVLLMIFSLSIYQANLSVICSLLIVYGLNKFMQNKDKTKNIVIKFLVVLLEIVVSGFLYLGLTVIIIKVRGDVLNDYAYQASQSILLFIPSIFSRIIDSYKIFFELFTVRKYGIIMRTGNITIINILPQILHVFLFVTSLILIIIQQIRNKSLLKIFLSLVLIILLPIAINLMVILFGADTLHTLQLFSYISVYVLAFSVFQNYTGSFRVLLYKLVSVAVILIIINNVYATNILYFKQQMNFNQAYSFYTVVLSQIYDVENYTTDTKVALIGDVETPLVEEQFYENKIFSGDQGLVNYYTRQRFIKNYLGSRVLFADSTDVAQIELTKEFEDMPIYPNKGSIENINGIVVVKLNNKAHTGITYY